MSAELQPLPSMPVTIALVGPLPPPGGGMANQCRQLAQLLQADGVTVRLVRTNEPYRPQWLEKVRFLRAPARVLPYWYTLWRTCGAVDLVHLFANSGWSWHFYAAPAILIARLRRVPVIVNYRGGGAAEFFANAPRWVAKTMASADSLVVPSGFLREVFTRFGFSPRIIPNIIDVERFRPRRRASADAPHVVVTRNLEPIYDIGTALEALAIVHRTVPRARMTIAGKGPELAALRKRCQALGLESQVHFAGSIDSQAIADLIGSADVFLNTSLVDNMPISILEAFASGVPVASTNVGGIPYVAENERTAVLFAPKDPAACAAAIIRLLTDTSLARRLSLAGLEESKRYSWNAVRQLWCDEYARMAARRRTA